MTTASESADRPDAREVAALFDVDALVLGSLPPGGRDLDLLVPREHLDRQGRRLEEAGWQRRGGTWARFGDGTAYAADLIPAEEYADPARWTALLAAARPIDGHARLLAPAERHQILLLALRLQRGLRLDERKVERLRGMSDAAFDEAAAEAANWGLRDEVGRLRRARATGPEPETPSSRLPRPPSRTLVVSLSGLDGSGKSTHAEALERALTALGYDVRIEWTKLGRDPVLDLVARPVKAVLARVRRRPGPPPDPSLELVDEAGERRNHPDGPPPPPDAGKSARQSSRWLNTLWVYVVAWANARTLRRTARGHAGAVLISDRWSLDTRAHLRYRYERAGRLRGAPWISSVASPRPVHAVFLDVPPEVARARKPEQYTTADLRRLRALYLEETERVGFPVHVVDVDRPLEVVTAEIAQHSWAAVDASDVGRADRLRALLGRLRRR